MRWQCGTMDDFASTPGSLTIPGLTGIVIGSRQQPLRVLPIDYIESKCPSEIGEGGTATVHSANLPELDDDEVAVKLPKKQDMMVTLVREAVVLLAAGQYGPGLLALVEGDKGCAVYAWVQGQDGSVTRRTISLCGVVMKKAHVGCVIDCVSPYTSMSEHIRTWSPVCKGIYALHQLGFVHCDVKPDNALLDYVLATGRTTGKVCDFGFARRHFEGRFLCKEFVGTDIYAAPEMLALKTAETDGKPVQPVWMTTKIDVYSWAKSMLACMCIPSSDPIKFIQHRLQYGDILAPLLSGCLEHAVDARLDMATVVACMHDLECRVAEEEQQQAQLAADMLPSPLASRQHSVAVPAASSASTALPSPTYDEAVRYPTTVLARLNRSASSLPAYSHKAQDCRPSCSSTAQDCQPACISHRPSSNLSSDTAGSSAAESCQPTYPGISHSPSSCLSSLSCSYPAFENCETTPTCFQGSCQHSWGSSASSSWDSSTEGAAASRTSSAGGAACTKAEEETVVYTHCTGTAHIRTKGKGKLLRRVFAAAKRLLRL